MDLNATPLQAMVQAMGERARDASRALARASTAQKNRALEAAAEALVERPAREIGGHDRAGARADQDGRLERDRLAVGEP